MTIQSPPAPCPICRREETAESPLTSIPLHDSRHRFHAECLRPWLELENTCPLCRGRIGRITEPQQAVLASNVAAVAEQNLSPEAPLITAVRQNDSERVAQIVSESPPSLLIRTRAIKLAILNRYYPLLNALIQTDRHRRIAITYAAPQHIPLIDNLLAQAENREQMRREVIAKVAAKNRRAALNALIVSDVHRGIAIVHAAPRHMSLVRNLLAQAENREQVQMQAIVDAASQGAQPVLNALIQKDLHRGLAIAYAAPRHMTLVGRLFAKAENQEATRIWAIQQAASQNLQSALNILIETDQHRVKAITCASSSIIIQRLLAEAKDPEYVREMAIEYTASFEQHEKLKSLVQSDPHRAIALPYLASNHMELVQKLIEEADNSEWVINEAIKNATTDELGPPIKLLQMQK